MAQPRRGLANTLLEPGYDLSPVSPQMYDSSGRSLAELWGATVVTAEEPLRLRPRPLSGTVEGAVAAGPGAAGHALELTDPSAVIAVNGLLDLGVEVVRLADGRAAVAGDAYGDLVALAGAEGLAPP